MKGIDEKLGIDEKPVDLEEINVVSNGSEEDLKEDYIIAREQIMLAIVRSGEVLEEAVRSVKTDCSPRGIEVASQVIKTVTENTSKLLELHEKFRKLEEVKKVDKQNTQNKQSDNNKVSAVRGTLDDALKELKVVEGGKK